MARKLSYYEFIPVTGSQVIQMPLIVHTRIENGKKRTNSVLSPSTGQGKEERGDFQVGERGDSINMSAGKLIMSLAITAVCIYYKFSVLTDKVLSVLTNNKYYPFMT